MKHGYTAVRLRPYDSVVHANLGVALLELGKIQDAKAELIEGIRIDPKLSEAYANLADLLVKQYEKSEAISWLKLGLKTNPTSVQLRSKLENLER